MLMGDVIKLHREKLNLTQEELGERIGVSRQAVQQWEANKTGPQRKVLPRLAEALGISPAVLNPLMGTSVQPISLPQEHHTVPHYVLADLALLTVDLAGQFVWPAATSTVAVSEDLASTVAVTITDDLMSPDYLPGDVILIDKSVKPQTNDDIVIFVQEGAALLRRYIERGRNRAGRLVFDLITPNAESATITLTEGDGFTIIGTVVETRRKRKR
jgi:transcriptional regulator with XRE-family HTH domain